MVTKICKYHRWWLFYYYRQLLDSDNQINPDFKKIEKTLKGLKSEKPPKRKYSSKVSTFVQYVMYGYNLDCIEHRSRWPWEMFKQPTNFDRVNPSSNPEHHKLHDPLLRPNRIILVFQNYWELLQQVYITHRTSLLNLHSFPHRSYTNSERVRIQGEDINTLEDINEYITIFFHDNFFSDEAGIFQRQIY